MEKKSVVFPVVMYRWETWAIKKAECQRIDDFMFWWERTLESLGLPRDQSILKESNPTYSLEGLMLKLKLQYFGHLMWRDDSLEKTLILGKIGGKRIRGQQNIRWFQQTLGDSEGQGSLAWCISWGQKESDRT